MEIQLVQGDITEQRADVIVNPANSSLLGGGGVDGAIHRRGGPEILEACRKLRASRYGKGLATGQAVATSAGRLDARWVIHTVGPVWSADTDRSDLLASCYRETLRVADEVGAHTLAFPAISAGTYGWPMDDAARIGISTLRTTATSVTRATFVLFDAAAFSVFAARKAQTMGGLFDDEPGQWGLRGDPHAWAALRDRLALVPVPADEHGVEDLLQDAFRAVVGIDLKATGEEMVYREEFAHGGMSSGHVSLSTWRDRLIPLLTHRARESSRRNL